MEILSELGKGVFMVFNYLYAIFVFFSTIFNEGAYLICKSIFHEALKDGILAYSFRFCHATNHCYKTNCVVKRVVLAICHHCRQGSVSKTTYLSIGCLRNTFVY